MKKEVVIVVGLIAIGILAVIILDITGGVINITIGCVEDDGGKDFFTKGTTKLLFQKGTSSNLTDRCLGGVELKEFYCEDNHIKVEKKMCEGRCVNGACI